VTQQHLVDLLHARLKEALIVYQARLKEASTVYQARLKEALTVYHAHLKEALTVYHARRKEALTVYRTRRKEALTVYQARLKGALIVYHAQQGQQEEEEEALRIYRDHQKQLASIVFYHDRGHSQEMDLPQRVSWNELHHGMTLAQVRRRPISIQHIVLFSP
jgi:dsDNA-binding SOS-regulon protein